MTELDIFKNEYVPSLESSLLYKKWARDNAGEHQRWIEFRDKILAGANPAPPIQTTAFGKSLIAAGKLALPEGTTPPDPDPEPGTPGTGYFTNVFSNGDYKKFSTIFAAYGRPEHPQVLNWGGMPGYPNQYNDPLWPGVGQNVHDPKLRVALVPPPKPTPRGAQWASRQEVRLSDPPWYPGSTYDKSSIRLNAPETWGGNFTWGAERWFRTSFYLPDTANEKFVWPSNSWLFLFGLHTTSGQGYGNWQVGIRDKTGTSFSAHPKYFGWEFEGATPGSEWLWVPLVQISNPDGSRYAPNFNRWHTSVAGTKFSDKTDGWREIYQDGQLVLPRRSGANVRTGDTGYYMMWQNYKLHSATYAFGEQSSVIYFGDIEIGRTKAEVD